MTRQDFRSECDRRRQNGWSLTGNTYLHREAIKRDGGIWDAYAKAWLMPDQASYDRWVERTRPAPTPAPATKPASKPKRTRSPAQQRQAIPVVTGVVAGDDGFFAPRATSSNGKVRLGGYGAVARIELPSDPGYIAPLPSDRDAWPPPSFVVGSGDLVDETAYDQAPCGEDNDCECRFCKGPARDDGSCPLGCLEDNLYSNKATAVDEAIGDGPLF